MGNTTFFGVVLILVACGLWVVSLWVGRKPKHAVYVAKPFMNASEKALFRNLKQAFPDHHVFAQVRLADLVEVHPNLKGIGLLTWWDYFKPIAQKSVDFVLCGKDLNVIAAIEFDGPSHGRPDRQRADREKDDALGEAGIRIERFAGSVPKPDELVSLFRERVK